MANVTLARFSLQLCFTIVIQVSDSIETFLACHDVSTTSERDVLKAEWPRPVEIARRGAAANSRYPWELSDWLVVGVARLDEVVVAKVLDATCVPPFLRQDPAA